MTVENTNINIPSVSVTQFAGDLGELYGRACEAGVPFRSLPTPFLWGPAGIGKSDGVRQMAAKLAERTGKKVNVTDVRLLLFSPVDLRGVPVADEHRQFTDWLKPRIFDMDPGAGVINILFLDELSAAPQSVQAAAYQITLDRRIGEHSLPENCVVIAAGNRTTDQSVAYKMPKALCNRLMHFNVQSDFASWKRWAGENGIDPRIIGYLSFDNSRLCAEPGSSDLAYPTPRSWSFVSSIIKTMNSADLSKQHLMISACVGTDSATEFEHWCAANDSLPPVEDILRGECRVYPKSHDALFTLSASLAEAIRMRGYNLTIDEIENVCAYASNFPVDYAASFFKDINAIADAKLLLMRCRAMQDWMSKNRKHL